MCRCGADADDGKYCTCPLNVRHFIFFAHVLANCIFLYEREVLGGCSMCILLNQTSFRQLLIPVNVILNICVQMYSLGLGKVWAIQIFLICIQANIKIFYIAIAAKVLNCLNTF